MPSGGIIRQSGILRALRASRQQQHRQSGDADADEELFQFERACHSLRCYPMHDTTPSEPAMAVRMVRTTFSTSRQLIELVFIKRSFIKKIIK